VVRARLAIVSTLLALAGCAAIFGDDLSSNYGNDADAAPTNGGEGGAPGLEGGGATDGQGPGPGEDGSVVVPGDGGVLADGAIAAFGPTCQGADEHEAEVNDEAGVANTFTKVVCGKLGGAGDVDVFQIDLAGPGTLRVGWSRAANATLTMFGSGVNKGIGGAGGGGFNSYDLPDFKPPGRVTFTVKGSVQPQDYRILVSY
jgi:hypothetical protein